MMYFAFGQGTWANAEACSYVAAGDLSRRARRFAFVAAVGLAALSASSATASPLDDCFDRIAVAVGAHAAHHHAPRHIVHIRKARRVGPPHPHPHRIAAVRRHAAAPVQHVRYILRPRACGSHPQRLMSAVPGAPPPETPPALIAELAGPP